MKNDTAEHEDVLDLAVVGGGMAGLFAVREACARRYPKRALFEAAAELGGRVQSRLLGHGEAVFRAELGAMRFEWGLQPQFQKLVGELGLKVQDFVPYSAPRPREDVRYSLLPGEEACLRGPGGSLFDLWRSAIVRALRTACRSMPERLRFQADLEGGEDWLEEMGERHFEWLRNEAVFPLGDRGPTARLGDLGIWTLMRCGGVLSAGALAMLIEQGTFYHFLHRNIHAAESLVFWVRVFQSNGSIKTLAGGVSTVVHRLAASAAHRGARIHLQHRLAGLSPCLGRSGERLVSLQLAAPGSAPRTVLARRVVLALPQHALRALSPSFPADVRACLDTVIPMAMLKCFFLVRRPWWKDDRAETHAGTESCPAREIHYYSSPDRSMGMVMVYCDQPSYDFWASLRGEDDATKRLRHAAFASFMGVPEERVEDSLLVDWTQVPHQGAAAYFWKPGARVYDVMRRLSAFDFDGEPPSCAPRLHVCGCAFSDFQGFIEGALRTASLALAALHEGPAPRAAADGRPSPGAAAFSAAPASAW